MSEQELKDYIVNNEDAFGSLIETYGEEYLQENQPDDQVFPMDDESIRIACGDDCLNAITRAFFGGRYNFPQDSFNPYDEFFHLNGYANLVSIQDESDKNDYVREVINSKEDFASFCVDNGYFTEEDVESEE